LEAKIREAKLLAQGVCQQFKEPGEVDSSAPVEWQRQLVESGEMTHDARLSFAKECARAGKSPCVEIAVEVLQVLREDYPHVLAVEEELALAYLELGRTHEANELLEDVQLRYNQLSEETLCRIGRIWKDSGTELLDKKPKAAIQPLQYALDWYRRAYDLREDYYPGINVATLNFFLGNRGESKRVAEAVLNSTATGQFPQEQQPWIWATQAEAYLLLASFPDEHETKRMCDLAEGLYCQASINSPPSSVKAMKRQAQLILNHSPADVRDFWTEAKLAGVFKST
jgi:tetratricopeptide (TPR) repeat protein